ncbi:MAG: DUF2330 domain-containing protein [Myxococcaceae bacterium]|nr:DUF2330 domain-containing protein [Myxococcaceae bacterium]
MVRAAVALSVLLGSAPASAFCGFYVAGGGAELFNNATQVVLMRNGTRTVLSMQNSYQGPPEDFAMVIPVPVVLRKEQVKTLARSVFDKIDKLSAPRLVEYWEQDPCPRPTRSYEAEERAMPRPAAKSMAGMGARADMDDRVTVEAQFDVGEYEIVILSAEDALGLERWLERNSYKIPAGAAPLFRPYIQQGLKFFVAKVNSKKMTFAEGKAVLSPLRFHYDSERFELPVRLGLINAKDKQDLIVHVLARGQRYEVANLPNVTIPTNIDLVPSTKNEFGPFYASLFDKTQAKGKGAVVTEYAWDANSCDPCPTPALSMSDLVAFGLDVIDGAASSVVSPTIEVKNLADLPEPEQRYVSQAVNNVTQQSLNRQMRGVNWRGFVVTRLHARYDKKSLGEDLVFKAAPPIAGGREFLTDGEKLEQGAVAYGTNQFQGRYAIRYPWTGPIACSNPVRGRWGANPNGGGARPVPLERAVESRRDKDLGAFVESPVSELGVRGKKALAGRPVGLK